MGYDMTKESPYRGEDYFRLNVWGMGDARQRLYELGIVSDPPSPTWPSPPGDDSADEEAYRAEVARVTDSLNGEVPGVPAYKLGSNDGWLVTQLEISSGIAVADRDHPGWREALGADEESQYILRFVEWMEEADSGFRVW